MSTRETLLERFAPVLSAAAGQLFENLLAHVETFSEAGDGDIACQFPGGVGSWRILGPLRAPGETSGPSFNRWRKLDARILTNAPADFARFLKVCRGLEWGTVGDTGQLVLSSGFEGTLDCLGADAVNEATFGISFSPDIFSPIDINMGDFYFRHPLTETLCFQTEGCVMEVVGTTDPVEIYFREMHCELKDLRESSEFRRAFSEAPHRSAWLRDWKPD